jgi:cytochrome c oxidase subunit IV
VSDQTEHKSHKKEYFLVFLALGVLTLIELFIPGTKGLSTFAKGSALTFLAVGKACLVAYFYMHLKDETRYMKYLAMVPISAAFYAVVVVLESMFR